MVHETESKQLVIKAKSRAKSVGCPGSLMKKLFQEAKSGQLRPMLLKG